MGDGQAAVSGWVYAAGNEAGIGQVLGLAVVSSAVGVDGHGWLDGLGDVGREISRRAGKEEEGKRKGRERKRRKGPQKRGKGNRRGRGRGKCWKACKKTKWKRAPKEEKDEV